MDDFMTIRYFINLLRHPQNPQKPILNKDLSDPSGKYDDSNENEDKPFLDPTSTTFKVWKAQRIFAF